MEEAVEAGKVRSIGVSNFNQQRFTDLAGKATIMPALAQVECHPYYQQRELKAFLARFGTVARGVVSTRACRSRTPRRAPVLGARPEVRQVARSGHPALAHAGR